MKKNKIKWVQLVSGEPRGEPKIGEGVPIPYWPNPKGLECANQLVRFENVANCAQTQHNTLMRVVEKNVLERIN